MSIIKSVLRMPVRLYRLAKKFLYIHLRIQAKAKNIREIGTNGCSFFVAVDILPPSPIVYSFGVGENISFDVGMIEDYGAEVWAFDPTPKSIAWVEANVHNPKFHFYPYGISDKNEDAKFYLPRNHDYVSGSVQPRAALHDEFIVVPMKDLATIMSELGHEKIDLLKMDIEGSEFKVVKNILEAGISFGQLCIEVHDRFFADGDKKLKNMIMQLNAVGYSIVSISQTQEELTFIKA